MDDIELEIRCKICGRPFMLFRSFYTIPGEPLHVRFLRGCRYRAWHICGKLNGDNQCCYHYEFCFSGPWRKTKNKAIASIPNRFVKEGK